MTADGRRREPLGLGPDVSHAAVVTDRSTVARPEGAPPAQTPPQSRLRGPIRPEPATDAGWADVSGAEGEESMALSPSRFLNRDLSWLEFGARLLELASDDRVPLLDRVDFLALFAEGLDQLWPTRWPPGCGPARRTG
jgi:hypothetical protein